VHFFSTEIKPPRVLWMKGVTKTTSNTTEPKMKNSKIFPIAALTLTGALALAAFVPAIAAGHGDENGHRGPMEMFQQMDANSDGKVTVDEMKAARAAHFAETDTNGDGFLTTDEMQAGMLAKMQERMSQRTDRMMEHADADGDGKISADEAQAMPRLDKMMARLDKDGDGAISTEEMSMMKRGGWGHNGSGHNGSGHDGWGHGKMKHNDNN